MNSATLLASPVMRGQKTAAPFSHLPQITRSTKHPHYTRF
ncbi:hypothetical protein SELSPUOL_01669 [Selenomonas sputigena ATCC 35185]|uniref:Uncharacterized protein n=1 Tax=Selenomonas sputigena (strain ATCC 35185 / DSM 20758 / CCUG 44933 / VPI D19B-28) TaxID=546271 RepID=C9LW16_SELS3|nr:hypothetical protein SELSPUOL_01669 [Selenomonas sputigena ATCC 35185]